jgi:hypothetical protein
MPHFNGSEESDTLQTIDRLRDLLEASSHLDGPYSGRAYVGGEIGSYHDLTGIAADASPALVVMVAETDRQAATAGGPTQSEDRRETRLGIYGLVNIAQQQDATTIETAYREAVRLSDKTQKALLANEVDRTGGGSCLWYQMRIVGRTRPVKARDNSGFIVETIVAFYDQKRRT